MVDYGESEKLIKISEKMDKSDTYKGFRRSDISFVIPKISSDLIKSEEIFGRKNETSLKYHGCKT